ncbi:dockerin type 1 [Colletotrichum sojae]|uniref:Dockerin type 1 n=1 Tax=Colletotrichum sojae TaxID=2175907 RepID=A0A8H6IS52_9PEZI|nr:dockerin type 1 [Colletotrichum sojae]
MTPKFRFLSQSDLAADARREHRINANSFQQDALTTFNGWQYACFYVHKDATSNALLVSLARRPVPDALGAWETLTFGDYEQTADDGHNTISIGVCAGDGTIHVAFDHHCDPLHFRMSKPGVATKPEAHKWTPELFSPTHNQLPGYTRTGQLAVEKIFLETTYPRFVRVDDDLLLSYRIGIAGAGSDHLFKYTSSDDSYAYVGQFLTGVENNPYINGISYANGRLHVSGTYRGFVWYEGVDDPEARQYTVQAGPNGPENNYDLFYVSSGDLGRTFDNSAGERLANLEVGETVFPDAPGLVVCEIPRDSGIMNQEAQAADGEGGGFHVLNRENEVWTHYHRDATTGVWAKATLPGPKPTRTGARGDVVVIPGTGTVLFALPGNRDDSLTLVGARPSSQSGSDPESRHEYSELWRADGYSGEPQLEPFVSGGKTMVSMFTRTEEKERRVVVLDFAVDDDGN